MRRSTALLANLTICLTTLMVASAAEAQTPVLVRSALECVNRSASSPNGGVRITSGTLVTDEPNLACPLLVGPGGQTIGDLAAVLLYVSDNSSTANIRASLCARTLSPYSPFVCGPSVSTSGSSQTPQTLVLRPPPGLTSDYTTAWIEINGTAGVEKVIFGYAQAM